LHELSGVDQEAKMKVARGFRLLAAAEDAPPAGGIVPVMGMVMRSDLEKERQILEQSASLKKGVGGSKMHLVDMQPYSVVEPVDLWVAML
jgi:hypothetical protein